MLSEILLIVSICLAATIVLETLFALCLRIRGKDLWVVVLAQIVTNPIVVLSSNLAAYFASGHNSMGISASINSFLLITGVMELVAIVVEGAMYKNFFRNYKRINPYVLSLVLNCFSAIAGFCLLTIIGSLL